MGFEFEFERERAIITMHFWENTRLQFCFVDENISI